MPWLIETKEQLEWFLCKKYKEVFIEVIPYNNKEHPVNNPLTLLYIFPLGFNEGYIINIDHSESTTIENNTYNSLISTFKTIYVRDKKESLHYFIHPNIIDLTLNKPDYELEYPQAYHHFYKLYPEKKDINRIIPIVKHYECCNKIFNDLKSYIHVQPNQFFNNKFSLVFNYLERSGLCVERKRFESKFHKITSNKVFTQYNFKTITSRPSNRFKGVNYAALNGKDDTREIFIPQNDVLAEIDIMAYHPTLLAKLIGYKFENKDIHKAFAEMYGVDYKEAKQLTFKMLYSGNYGKYKDLEFFRKVKEYTNNLWGKFNGQGYIECPISKHRFEKDKLENMNPAKLLNYLLQGLESSNNVIILWEIIKLLKNKKSKLILYTYDSFLFDFDKSEAKVLYKEIKNIFKSKNLKTKISYGANYKFSQPS
jgi:hypothetical protein